jgi:hypothetical protein
MREWIGETISTCRDPESSQEEDTPQSPEQSDTPMSERVNLLQSDLLTNVCEQTSYERLGLAWSYVPRAGLEQVPPLLDTDYAQRVSGECQLQSRHMSVYQTLHPSTKESIAEQHQHKGQPATKSVSISSIRVPLVHESINLATPYMLQMSAPTVPGHTHMDHEVEMINNLLWHIRDSLLRMPHDLPEIKGLCIKLPEAYTGKDNFDKLDSWLQGLLHYFKLNCITADDRDADRILVMGNCLKGKAEW